MNKSSQGGEISGRESIQSKDGPSTCSYCNTQEKLEPHLVNSPECLQLYIKLYSITESDPIWLVCCLQNICVSCGLEISGYFKSHIEKDPCFQEHKSRSCLPSSDKIMALISKVKRRRKTNQEKTSNQILLYKMAVQGIMEGICVICKLFLDNIQQLSGQDHKRHKNIGPVLSFFWTHEGRIEEEKCRDIKGNFHICTSCQGNQDSGQGEAEAEIVRYPYKSEVKLIDVNDRTAFVPLAYFSEDESSMKEPDINTTIFLPSRSSDVCEENMMESITSALINTNLVQKQQYNVSNFFNTDPLVIPNVLFRAMLEKIGYAERGIRIGMNKTKTGNIVSDRTPEKKLTLSQKVLQSKQHLVSCTKSAAVKNTERTWKMPILLDVLHLEE